MLFFIKLLDINIEKGINIYQTLYQYLIKDDQIIIDEKIIIELNYLAIYEFGIGLRNWLVIKFFQLFVKIRLFNEY